MATKTMTGNDWNTAGDFDPVGVPVDGDEVIIPDTNETDITQASRTAGVNLAFLDVHRGFDKKFGTRAAPIKIATDLLQVYGSSGFFFDADDAPADFHSIDRTEIQLPSASVECELGSEPLATQADWALIKLMRGSILLKSTINWDASLGSVDVGWTTDAANDVRLRIAAGGPTLPKLRQSGGLVVSNSVITEYHCAGGRLEHDLAKITELFIYNGATADYNHKALIGDLTFIHVYAGGTLNLSANAKVKTIARVEEWPGSHVFFDRSLVTITEHNRMTDIGN